MISDTDTYLGDGLYAALQGGMIVLKAPREAGEHWVGLEPEVFDTLLQFAIQIGWLKRGERLR